MRRLWEEHLFLLPKVVQSLIGEEFEEAAWLSQPFFRAPGRRKLQPEHLPQPVMMIVRFHLEKLLLYVVSNLPPEKSPEEETNGIRGYPFLEESQASAAKGELSPHCVRRVQFLPQSAPDS